MLNPSDIALIQDCQSASIQQKQLVAEQLELIYDRKWFLIWVPKSLHGLELPLDEGCALLEELGYWDGGLSWTITLCSGANMFAGFIHPTIAEGVFSRRDVCFGGSGKVAGQAKKVAGGYILTGSWPYATGAPHLSHFTANGVADGVADESAYTSFFLDRADVLLHYDWDTFGLEATASHSFSVNGLFVSEDRAFHLSPEDAESTSPLFQVPFMPFAEATLFVNYLGMYRRFCDLVFKYFKQKSIDGQWMEDVGRQYFDSLIEARELAESAKTTVYALIRAIWNNAMAGSLDVNEQYYDTLAKETRLFVERMKGFVVDLFPKCGIAAAQRENELNIVFRNFFTATQHALLNRKNIKKT